MVSPKYVDVKAVNDMVLSRIPGDVITCVSNDSFDETDSAGRPIIGLDIEEEYLHGLDSSNIPTHILRLKKGMCVLCMNNLDQANGLCNGTRLIVKEVRSGGTLLLCDIVSSSRYCMHYGHTCLITHTCMSLFQTYNRN